MKAHPQIIRPHQRQPRRSDTPLSGWTLFWAIVAGACIAYGLWSHRQAVEPRVITHTEEQS